MHLVLLGLLTVTSAFAYIPPSQYWLRNWSKGHAPVKTLFVRSQVKTLIGTQSSEPSIRLKTYVQYPSKIMQVKVEDSTGTVLYFNQHTLGQLLPSNVDNGGVVAYLLLQFDSGLQAAVLRHAGIPIRTESELSEMKDEKERRDSEATTLARWKNDVFLAVGPGSRDTAWPQYWVTRAELAPVRLIHRSDYGMVDLQMGSMETFGVVKMPNRIDVMRARKEEPTEGILREEILEVAVNPDSKIIVKEFPRYQNGFTEIGKNSSSDIKSLIEQATKLLR